MNFLHPWAIGIGAGAIVLPVLIHFLTRPRPKSMPLSTIRFVQEAVKQRRMRNWLRDLLVLALRAIAIGCIAWTFARPLINTQPVSEADVSGRTERVVILDVSQSMAASQSGVDGFQLARVQALRFLKPGTNLRANLIIAGANADAVFESPSTNMNVLTDALAKTTAKPEKIDIQAAVNAAAQMLGRETNSDTSQELVVVSDFQRTNWATVDFSALPESTNIKLESTAPSETLDNIAILNVGFSEKPAAGNQANLEILIGNFSADARNVSVQVVLEDNVFVVEQICPPNTRTTISKDVTIQNAGWQTGWATILENEDALLADDAYPFVVQSIETPNVTIVTLQPPSQRPSSSYFLERALAPYDGERLPGAMQVSRIGPARFSSDTVSQSQLLIFDHPGRLQPIQIKLLASLIRRGRGVLYVSSEPVDATNLKLLYHELGSDLQAPVELVPSPRGIKRELLKIGSVAQKRRPFRVFGDSLTAVLSDVQVSGGLATQRIPDSLDDDILATLSDQSVLLFASSAGLGNLCVLNADLNQSNLPRHATFVPIVNELMETLLRSNNRRQTAYCGEPLTRLLPATVTSTDDLKILEAPNPNATFESSMSESKGEFRRSGEGVIWNWRRLPGPIVYRVDRNQDTMYALASHIPPEESELRSLDAKVMIERLSGGRSVKFHRVAETEKEHDDTWIWFAVATSLALVGEVIVLRFFKM